MARDERDLEALYRRGYSRRQFLQRAAALGISSATALSFLAACGPAAAPAPSGPTAAGGKPAGADGPGKLTFFGYAGANQGGVPRQVQAEHMKGNTNVTIWRFEGANAGAYR